jgi:hypothetical protein
VLKSDKRELSISEQEGDGLRGRGFGEWTRGADERKRYYSLAVDV